MIRFKALNEQTNREILGIGIVSEDLALLAQGQPLAVKMSDVGFENSNVDVVLFYGRTMEDLNKIHGIPIPPSVKLATADELSQLRNKPEGWQDGFLPAQG